MIKFRDFLPGKHMVTTGLATLQLQVDAANQWIADMPGARIVNVETLFDEVGSTGGGRISNIRSYGVRVWYIGEERVLKGDGTH